VFLAQIWVRVSIDFSPIPAAETQVATPDFKKQGVEGRVGLDLAVSSPDDVSKQLQLDTERGTMFKNGEERPVRLYLVQV